MSFEKSPISILNETMARLGIIPSYEVSVCENEIHGHKSFEAIVSCDKVTAIGTGNSKKEAKQSAARALLAKMTPDQLPSQLILSASSCGITAMDYVQKLQSLCSKYKLEEPVYKDSNSEGISHLITFTIKCLVSQIEIEGKGKSKKIAKQNAAKLMLETLKNNLSINDVNEPKKLIKDQNQLIVVGKKNNSETQINYNLNIRDQKLALKQKFSSDDIVSRLKNLTELIMHCISNATEDTSKKIKLEFQTLMDMAQVNFYHILFQTTEPETYQLTIQLNTIPEIFETSLGKTREEAEMRTMNKILCSLNRILI